MNRERATANFLRFIAILQILTFGIVLMPEAWIAWWHGWLGLGKLPEDAVLRYVIRGAGLPALQQSPATPDAVFDLGE